MRTPSDYPPANNFGEPLSEELNRSSEFLSSDERIQEQQYRTVSGLRDVGGPAYEVGFTQTAQSRTTITQGQMGTAYTVVETHIRHIDVQHAAMGSESGNYAPQRQANPQPPSQQLVALTQSQPKPIADQYTEDGRAVLFYVRALYNYKATIPEEFDFQAHDMIAVTATPEDGWWSGELIDKNRRVLGRHIFPSNFVCLL